MKDKQTKKICLLVLIAFLLSTTGAICNNGEKPVEEFTITLSANPVAGGTVSGGGKYKKDTVVTVTANANNNYSFVNWTEEGKEVSTDKSYSFPVTKNRSLVANFVETSSSVQCIITLSANPPEGGTVSGGGTYNKGQEVTVQATPNEGICLC